MNKITREKSNPYTRQRAVELAMDWAKHAGETSMVSIMNTSRTFLKFLEGKSEKKRKDK